MKAYNSVGKIQHRRSYQFITHKSFRPDFYTLIIDKDPKSCGEAMSSHEAPFCCEAMKDEIHSIRTLRFCGTFAWS